MHLYFSHTLSQYPTPFPYIFNCAYFSSLSVLFILAACYPSATYFFIYVLVNPLSEIFSFQIFVPPHLSVWRSTIYSLHTHLVLPTAFPFVNWCRRSGKICSMKRVLNKKQNRIAGRRRERKCCCKISLGLIKWKTD
jgi:hypothetical protein